MTIKTTSTGTEVTSGPGTVIFNRNMWGGISVALRSEIDGTVLAQYSVDPDDLVAAVAKEAEVRLVAADARVIERKDIPRVLLHAVSGSPMSNGQSEYDPARARAKALAYVAIDEYLENNPPPDPEQVGAFLRVLNDTHTSWDSRRLAEFLVEHGARIEPKA